MADTKTIEFKIVEDAPQGGGPQSSSTDPQTGEQAKLDHEALVEALQKLGTDRSNAIRQGIDDFYGPFEKDRDSKEYKDAMAAWNSQSSFDTSTATGDELDKTIEALKTEFESLSQASQAAAQAGQASAASSSGLAGSALQAANALAGGGGAGGAGGGGIGIPGMGGGGTAGGGLGGAGGAALGLAGAAAATAAVLAGLVSSGLAFNKVVDGLVESMGQLSGEVQAAVAEGQVQKIEDDLRAANEIGDTLASLQGTRNDIASELRGIVREAVELLGPLYNLFGRVVEGGLSGIRGTLEIINDVINAIKEAVDFLINVEVDGLEEAKKTAKNTKPAFNTNMPFDTQIREIFDFINLGIPNPQMGNNGFNQLGDPNI